MPLKAAGWTTNEDEQLADLVKANSFLYNWHDTSRKNSILERESTWMIISHRLGKTVEDSKKRWRGLRDGYMRSKRLGSVHKRKAVIFKKLQFLDVAPMDLEEEIVDIEEREQTEDPMMVGEQQVITDNQEYYEITLVETKDAPQPAQKQYIKILPKIKQEKLIKEELPRKITKKGSGRKKTVPIQRDSSIPPIKILPKPFIVNGPKLIQYVEDPKTPEQRSQTIDKLIERMLKENTNEIDVFFRSMAASVKKLQPNLIPKVKMEVCNVIAKYEMQSFEKM